MHIPPRFQSFLDDDPDTEERLRKGRGRIGAYRSSNPDVRRTVRLAGRVEIGKVHRAAKALKVTVRTDESLERLRELAYDHYRFRKSLIGENVAEMAWMHPKNLNRLTVNFIRHARTEYDHSLAQNRFSTGIRHAAFSKEIKVMCLDEIARLFPELAVECERQSLVVDNSLERAAERLPEAA